jgi:zinc protease
MKTSHPDYTKLLVANFALGGHPLCSRLANRVRQKEGLSYDVRSAFTAEDEDDDAGLFITANCNPQNIDKVDSAITDELKKLVAQGVSENELADIQKVFLQQVPLLLSNDGQLVSMLSTSLHVGRNEV